MSEMYKQANTLINVFNNKCNETFGKRIIAIYKIGSLGDHGDFSKCSDVDVALFLDNRDEADNRIVQDLWTSTKNSNIPYAERLSVFWSDIDNFGINDGRFPALDRLDLINHGCLVDGKDIREKLNRPQQSDIINESARFIDEYMLTEDKLSIFNHNNALPDQGARYLSKLVLFPVRLIYTAFHPNRVASNLEAVLYLINILKYSPLINQLVLYAYTVRSLSPYEPIKIPFNNYKDVLTEIYLICIDKYINHPLLKDKDILDILKKHYTYLNKIKIGI
jgi:hypothetical protein